MIETHGRGPTSVHLPGPAEPVGGDERIHSGQGRLRRDVHELLPERGHTGGVDDIQPSAIAELLALESLRIRRPGIVNADQPACGINQPAEVAVAHGLRRNGVVDVRVGDPPIPFVGEEPEGAVAAVVDFGQQNRAAGAPTELAAVRIRRRCIGGLPRAGTTHPAVAVGFEQRAVKAVGAALGAGGHHDGTVVLGRDVVAAHADFLDGVQSRRPVLTGRARARH